MISIRRRLPGVVPGVLFRRCDGYGQRSTRPGKLASAVHNRGLPTRGLFINVKSFLESSRLEGGVFTLGILYAPKMIFRFGSRRLPVGHARQRLRTRFD